MTNPGGYGRSFKNRFIGKRRLSRTVSDTTEEPPTPEEAKKQSDFERTKYAKGGMVKKR